MAERNPKDINKKLRSLTKEQAEALYQQMNSAYAPENLPGPTKKPAAKKPATKKSAAKAKTGK